VIAASVSRSSPTTAARASAVAHRNPPLAAASAFEGHAAARGSPPVDYRHKSPPGWVSFGRRSNRVNLQRRLTQWRARAEQRKRNRLGSNGSELEPRAGFGESAFPIDGISRNCQPQPYVPQMSRRRLPDRRVAIVVSGRIFAEQKDACERVGADRAIVTALHTKQEILHALTNLQISSHSRLN
jgi:hypothetical protein